MEKVLSFLKSRAGTNGVSAEFLFEAERSRSLVIGVRVVSVLIPSVTLAPRVRMFDLFDLAPAATKELDRLFGVGVVSLPWLIFSYTSLLAKGMDSQDRKSVV